MTHERIRTRYIGKPIMGVVQALPELRGLTIETDEYKKNGCCGTNDSYKEKLHDLGLRPNQTYYIVIAESHRDTSGTAFDKVRNNWSAIWSLKRLKEHHRHKTECLKCRDNFGKIGKLDYRKCGNCPHGLNVTTAFIINPDYLAYFHE